MVDGDNWGQFYNIWSGRDLIIDISGKSKAGGESWADDEHTHYCF